MHTHQRMNACPPGEGDTPALAVLKTGGPGGGSGLQFSLGNRGCWADFGPDPGGNFIGILLLGP